jgi:Family of unknown function (DUF5641)
MMNSRRIQPVGDASDFEALMPNHFLNGGCGDSTFLPDLPKIRLDLQDRLKYQLEVEQHFWKRFQTEIVPLMGPRKKWMLQQEQIKEDEVVIEVGESVHR